MELEDIKEITQNVTRKLVSMAMTPAPRKFGFPISLGVHCGKGFEKFYSHFSTVEGLEDKKRFAALCHLLIDVHNLDWAVITMDAFIRRQKPEEGLLFEMGTRMRLPRNRFDSADRISALVSIGMTKNRHFHMVEAVEDDKGGYLPLEDLDMASMGIAGVNTSGDLLCFNPPSSELQELINALKEEDDIMQLIGSMPMLYTRYASCFVA